MVRWSGKGEYSDIADDDILLAVDISDTTSAPTGTSKGITATNLRAYMSALSLPLSGGTMTGDITMSGNNAINFDGTNGQIVFGGAQLNLISTGNFTLASTSTGSTIKMLTEATSDSVVMLETQGKNSLNAFKVTSQFETRWIDNTESSESSFIRFLTLKDGSPFEAMLMNFGNTGAVRINDNLEFLNLGGGSNPILSSNSPFQVLTLGGRLAFDNIGTGDDPVLFSNSTTKTLTAQMKEFEFFESTSTIGSINEIRMAALNSAAQLTFYAQMDTNIADPTDGTEDGTIDFSTIVNGVSTKILGLNTNIEKEVFIYDNIRFNNTFNSLSGANALAGGSSFINGETISFTGTESGATNATAIITVVAGAITAYAIVIIGSGYKDDEELDITGGSGTGATANAITTFTNDPVLFANSASKRLELTGDFDINTGNILQVHEIALTSAGSTSGILPAIGADGNGVFIDIQSGKDLEILINSVEFYTFSTSGFSLKDHVIGDVLRIESDSTISRSELGFIRAGNGTGQGFGFRNFTNTLNAELFFNTSDAFELNINTVTEYTFSATVADFNNNLIINMELSAGITASSSISYDDGITQTFNPNATNAGVNVGSLTGNPSTPANGDVWYNSTSNILFGFINGGNVDLGAAGIAGILSINGDTTATALIIGTTNQITVGTAGGTTTINVGSDVVIKTAPTTYTAGIKQTFNPNSTNAGLNVGIISGTPSAQVNGDIWIDSTSNKIFARINDADVDLGIGGGSGITSINTDTTSNQIIAGGLGIDVGNVTNTHTISIGTIVVTLADSQILTNKNYNLTSNTLTGTPSQFNNALTGDSFVFLSNVPLGNASGTLGVANGGTGVVSFVAGGILYGNTATNILTTAAPSSGQIIVGNTTVPVFVTMSGDATIDNTGAVTVSIASTNLTDTGVIVRTNQVNTFGDFNQTFADDKLFIQNPAATSTYQIIASAITANRIVTLPLLTGNDTFVTLAFAQTLTNKTLTTPTIASFTNATHTHTTAAGGGTLLSTSALSDTADIAYLNTANTYTAGVRQNFVALLLGTAGLNIGGIAGNPTTQVNGDIWLNTSTNQILGRINGFNVDLSFTDGAGFLPLSGGTMTGNIEMGTNQIQLGTLLFNNALAGADPILTSSSTTQTLSLTGTFEPTEIQLTGSRHLFFDGTNGDIVFGGNQLNFISNGNFSYLKNAVVSMTIQYLSNVNTVGSTHMLEFQAKNTSGAFKVSNEIETSWLNATTGFETSTVQFRILSGNVIKNIIELNPGNSLELLINNNIEFFNPSGVNPTLVSNSGFKLLRVTGDFQIDGSIFDENEHAIIQLNPADNAINFITITNAAMSSNPIIGVVGVDSNLGIDFTTKNLGAIRMSSCRFQITVGANVATNAGLQLILGGDGNVFTLSNGNTVEEIADGNWQKGSIITLIVGVAGTTITSNALNPAGGFRDITLSGAFNNQAISKNVTLMLVSVLGTPTWLEISRG